MKLKSRPIKFRVWDKESKKYLLPEKQEFVILSTMPSFGVTLPYEDEWGADCVDWADADLIAGRYELEQGTGLKDSNGKEIYEGDILKDEFGFRYTVEFSEKHLRYIGRTDQSREVGLYKITNAEVIGNIHEDAGGAKI